MAGSHRIVDHTTFAELQWSRDPFALKFFILPPGFQEHSKILGESFLEIIRDIFALQCIRDSALFGHENAISMARIDNHQASIQSRLVSLPNHSSISECCHLAAYLCSTMLRCKIWRTSTLPVMRPLDSVLSRSDGTILTNMISLIFHCNCFTSYRILTVILSGIFRPIC
jgi:hypothetical protein